MDRLSSPQLSELMAYYQLKSEDHAAEQAARMTDAMLSRKS